MHVFWKVKTLYQPAVFLSNGTADWIHRPSAIQRARTAARRELRGHFYSKHLVARLFISSLILSLSRVSSLSLSPPLSHPPRDFEWFWPHRTTGEGEASDWIVGGSHPGEHFIQRARISRSPRFWPSFPHFLPFLFIEVIDTEHLKSRTAGGVLESQILGR